MLRRTALRAFGPPECGRREETPDPAPPSDRACAVKRLFVELHEALEKMARGKEAGSRSMRLSRIRHGLEGGEFFLETPSGSIRFLLGFDASIRVFRLEPAGWLPFETIGMTRTPGGYEAFYKPLGNRRAPFLRASAGSLARRYASGAYLPCPQC